MWELFTCRSINQRDCCGQRARQQMLRCFSVFNNFHYAESLKCPDVLSCCFYGTNFITENIQGSTQKDLLKKDETGKPAAVGLTWGPEREPGVFCKSAVVSSISGVWGRPPKEAGLDWIWERCGSSHGGAEEEWEGGQVHRHQMKERAEQWRLQIVLMGVVCSFSLFSLKIIWATDVKWKCLQLDPASSRHQSAHIPTKGCRSWFRRCRMMVWEVKPPPAAVVKPISAASVSSRDHSSPRFSDFKKKNTRIWIKY